MHIVHNNQMVCSSKVEFDIDENGVVTKVIFTGGCNGNLKAIAKLCEGKKGEEIVKILKGNTCGFRPTSCADQFAIAIEEALKNK